LTVPDTGGGVVVGEEELEQPVSDPSTDRHAAGTAMTAIRSLLTDSLRSHMWNSAFPGTEVSRHQ
jgi:hypothetical protein